MSTRPRDSIMTATRTNQLCAGSRIKFFTEPHQKTEKKSQLNDA